MFLLAAMEFCTRGPPSSGLSPTRRIPVAACLCLNCAGCGGGVGPYEGVVVGRLFCRLFLPQFLRAARNTIDLHAASRTASARAITTTTTTTSVATKVSTNFQHIVMEQEPELNKTARSKSANLCRARLVTTARRHRYGPRERPPATTASRGSAPQTQF